MKTSFLISNILIVCIFISSFSCESANQQRYNGTYLISSQKIAEFTEKELDELGLDADNGAEVYYIVYNTTDINGEKTTASGALIIPTSKELKSYPLVSYQHGTTYKRDNLLKPFNQHRLEKSLEKFKTVYGDYSKFNLKEIINLIGTDKLGESYKSRFLVKLGDKLNKVITSDIAYFYRDELVFLVTNSRDKFIVDYSLEELSELLNPNEFFRINRQFLVHINSIIQVHTYFKGRLKIHLSPPTDYELIISQEKASRFKEWMDGKA